LFDGLAQIVRSAWRGEAVPAVPHSANGLPTVVSTGVRASEDADRRIAEISVAVAWSAGHQTHLGSPPLYNPACGITRNASSQDLGRRPRAAAPTLTGAHTRPLSIVAALARHCDVTVAGPPSVAPTCPRFWRRGRRPIAGGGPLCALAGREDAGQARQRSHPCRS